MSHTNIWKNKGLHREFSGVVTGEEILESNFELHANPKFHEINYIIDDFSHVSHLAMDADHIKILAKTNNIIAMSKGKLKMALLLKDDGLGLQELAEHYIALTQNSRFQIKIFYTLEDIQKWVNN